MRAVEVWARENRNLDANDEVLLAGALEVLSRRLSEISAKWIRRLYKLGRNRKLEMGDLMNLASEIRRNQAYIEGSMIPYVQHDIAEHREEPTEEWIGGRSEAWRSRAGLYAGAAWTARWVGFGETVRERVPYGALPQRVRRVLDPGAEHCTTCPPKAREYSSWEDMLVYCGGLPADGSDSCRSNCRCIIEVEDNPGRWLQVI